MSKARAKGTRGENFFLPKIRKVFYPNLPAEDQLPDGSDHPIQRAPLKGVQDRGDFTGVPWLHEAKHTLAPHFMEWARMATKKADNWVILWKGDLRKAGNGPYVLMPLHVYLGLVADKDWSEE
jgi:hypothetical protein